MRAPQKMKEPCWICVHACVLACLLVNFIIMCCATLHVFHVSFAAQVIKHDPDQQCSNFVEVGSHAGA